MPDPTRIALVSDVHGILTALEAVLADDSPDPAPWAMSCVRVPDDVDAERAGETMTGHHERPVVHG